MRERAKTLSFSLILSILILPVWFVAGCSPPVQPTVRVLAASTHCTASAEGLRLIATPAGLVDAFARGTSLGAADYDREVVVLAAMGQKSSAGYALSLSNSLAVLEDDVAVIELEQSAPGDGEVSAQVLTHPCIALAVSRGEYSSISAKLASGETLGTVAVEAGDE